MLGILYVCHGSRDLAAIAEVQDFIASVMNEVDVSFHECCFLELAQPDIDQGIAKLIEKGVTKIAVIPVLLLSAGHYYIDIPKKLEANKEQYPNISFAYGKPLGVQDRLIDILVDRINETGVPINHQAKILLVGRGSTYPETKVDIERLAKILSEKIYFNNVNYCFLAACKPSFAEEFALSLKGNYSQVWIVPYLWFTGFLMNDLQKTIVTHKDVKKQIILTKQLGSHPNIKEALKDRVYETVQSLSFIWG